MSCQLKGRVAFVTGGARGIGQVIAEKLGRAGASIGLNDIEGSEVERKAHELRQIGLKVEAIPANIAEEAEVIQAIEQVKQRLGSIDILINNAGISPKSNGRKLPLTSIPLDEWNRVIAVNLTGPFLCSKHVAAEMAQHKWGRIINIASVMGKLGAAGPPSVTYGPFSPSGIHYCVSKSGLICLTKSVARELAPYGVTCNAVAPGAIAAGMGENLQEEAISPQIPLGRLGQASEVADAVLFLVSEGASYITGETIDVNGGWVMD